MISPGPEFEIRRYRYDLPREAAAWPFGKVLGIGGLYNSCQLDLSDLDGFESLYGLHIQDAELFDLTALPRRSELRYLGVDATKQAIDFDQFPNLEWLNVTWSRKHRFPAETRSLRRLDLRSYPGHDLRDLPAWTSLKDLMLAKGSLRALDGIASFPALARVSMHYLRKLAHVGELGRCGATTFVFAEACKRVANWEGLGQSRTLQELVLSRCGSLASLGFLTQCPSLRNVRMVKTYVADGNMWPLAQMDVAIFDRKVNYSHSESEIQALIDLRRKASEA